MPGHRSARPLHPRLSVLRAGDRGAGRVRVARRLDPVRSVHLSGQLNPIVMGIDGEF